MAEAANIWPDTAPPTNAAAIVKVTNPIRSLMVMVAVSLIQQGPAPAPESGSGSVVARQAIPAEISRLDRALTKHKDAGSLGLRGEERIRKTETSRIAPGAWFRNSRLRRESDTR